MHGSVGLSLICSHACLGMWSDAQEFVSAHLSHSRATKVLINTECTSVTIFTIFRTKSSHLVFKLLEGANEEPEDTKQRNAIFLLEKGEMLDNLDRGMNIAAVESKYGTRN